MFAILPTRTSGCSRRTPSTPRFISSCWRAKGSKAPEIGSFQGSLMLFDPVPELNIQHWKIVENDRPDDGQAEAEGFMDNAIA
jgi:hypothetical protein